MVLQPFLGPGLTQRCLHTCLSPAHLLQPCIPSPFWTTFSHLFLSFPTHLVLWNFSLRFWGGESFVHSYDVTHPLQSSDCNMKSSTLLFKLLYTKNTTPNSLVHFYLLYTSVCDVVSIVSFLLQSCFLQCCYAGSIQLEEQSCKCCGFKQCLGIPCATFQVLFHIAISSTTYQFHLRHL